MDFIKKNMHTGTKVSIVISQLLKVHLKGYGTQILKLIEVTYYCSNK